MGVGGGLGLAGSPDLGVGQRLAGLATLARGGGVGGGRGASLVMLF